MKKNTGVKLIALLLAWVIFVISLPSTTNVSAYAQFPGEIVLKLDTPESFAVQQGQVYTINGHFSWDDLTKQYVGSFLILYVKISFDPVTAVEGVSVTRGTFPMSLYSTGPGYMIYSMWAFSPVNPPNPGDIAFSLNIRGLQNTTVTISQEALYYNGALTGMGGHGWGTIPVKFEYEHADNGATLGKCSECDNEKASVPKVGSGVDYASGNVNIDLNVTNIVSTTSLETNVTLYYNSLDENSGPLGPSWTYVFNQSILANPDGSLTYRMDDGKRYKYTDTNADNVYESLAQYGDYSTITEDTNGYTLVQKDRTTYSFDIAGKLLQITDRNSNSVICAYTGNLLTTVTLPNGRTISFTYYPTGLVEKIIDPANNETLLTYTPQGQLNTVSKNNGEWVWQFTYYANKNLIQTKINPRSFSTQYAYNASNKITQITDANGNSTGFIYDETNSKAYITDKDNKTRTAVYNLALDAWTDTTDALGNSTKHDFNPANKNLNKITKPSGAETNLTYDSRGNVLTETDPGSCLTTYCYEDPNNPDMPSRIINAQNVTTYMEYSLQGNIVRRVDALGTDVEQETTYEYWPDGKLKAEHQDPNGLNLTTEYYYTNGYLTKRVIDPAGLNIAYELEYNDLGQMVKSYDPRYPDKSVFTTYQYDYRGNRISQTGPDGVITKADFDLNDNNVQQIADFGGLNITSQNIFDNTDRMTTAIMDPAGENIVTSTEYYSSGKVRKTTDAEGATTEYFYLDNGWLWYTKRQLTDTEYAFTYYDYWPNGTQKTITDPENHITSYTYTIKDKLETVTDPEGNVTTYAYEECGCCSAAWVKDAEQNITYTAYDELKRPKYIRTAESDITTAFVYDSVGRRTQTVGPWYDTNRNGIVDVGESSHPTEYKAPAVSYTVYDNANRVTQTYVNSHQPSQFFYDAAGNQTKAIDSQGDITEYVFNTENRLEKSIVDPVGLNEQKFFLYDSVGRQAEVTVGYGTSLATTSFYIYNNANWLTSLYTANSQYATSYQYNKRGQQTAVTDANSKTTVYEYFKVGQLQRVTNANDDSTEYAYNKDGNKTKATYYQTQGGSAIDTFYTYYGNHLLKTTDCPGYGGVRNITLNEYYKNGNLKFKINPKGQKISYYYDKNSRLTSKVYPDNTNITFVFDAESNVLITTDPNTSNQNEYDDLGRLTKITDYTYSPAKTIQYTYKEDGLRATMTEPEGGVVEYSYDAVKRLTSVKRNGIVEGSYEYNSLGMRTKLTYGNGAYAEYQYSHPQKWLMALNNKKSDGAVISSFAYTYDNVGNRMTMSLAGGDLLTYTYDNTYQLTSETRTGATPYQISWTYDGAGNRLTQNKNGVLSVYAYNDANQLLTEITGGVTTNYEFDANGNQIKRTKGSEISTWTYDYENRQVTYSDPMNSGQYWYDASGRRIKRTASITTFKSGGTQNAADKIGVGNGKGQGQNNGQGTQNAQQNMTETTTINERYFYDGANVVADYNANNDMLLSTYVTSFLDQNLMRADVESKYYYFQDNLGSVQNILDSNQIIRNSYEYYAFGVPLNWNKIVSNRYTYTGRERDEESQNYYYRTRQYDSYTGRFIQRDRTAYINAQLLINLYYYTNNRPIYFRDSSGMQPVEISVNFATDLPHSNPIINASLYAVVFEFIFKGENLEKYEFQQLINLKEFAIDETGHKLSNEEILKGKIGNPELFSKLNTDEYVVDSGWDWQPVIQDKKLLDLHRSAAPNSQLVNYTFESYLTISIISAKIQVRCNSTPKQPDPPIITEHSWGYKWDNLDARVPYQYKASSEIGNSSFYELYGVNGFPDKYRRDKISDFPYQRFPLNYFMNTPEIESAECRK